MKLRKYDIILGILIIFNILFCLYLAINENTFCINGNSCDNVKNSIYGSILGIPVIWIGVIAFSILFVLFILARYDKDSYWIFFTATIIGAIGAIYFLIIQFFILKQVCSTCLVTDILAIIMLGIVIFEYLDFKKEIKKIEKEIGKFKINN
jgi:uncharacterized membrane protein